MGSAGDVATAGSDFDQIWATRPAFWDTYMTVYRVVLSRCEPVEAELCRLRMAALIGCDLHLALRWRAAVAAGLTEDKISALRDWPTSDAFSARERACIAFAEQFVIDSASIDDADVDALLVHMS